MGRYNYTMALEKLTNWATKEGYNDITFDYWDISEINWERDSLNKPKHIKIEGKYSKEIKVYLLLHELGHHQLRKDWDKFKRVLPDLAYAEDIHLRMNDIKYKRRVSYTVSCMEEEFKAWEEGLKLGDKFGIRINKEKWDKFKRVLPDLAYAEDIHLRMNDIKYKRRVSYTVSCMEEEFKAWEEGLKLGDKFGIRINKEKWTTLKAKCLMSYMRYYVEKKQKIN